MRRPPTLALIAKPEPRAGARSSTSASRAQRRNLPPCATMHGGVSAALRQDRRESVYNGCQSTAECIEAGRTLASAFLPCLQQKRSRIDPSGGDTPITCWVAYQMRLICDTPCRRWYVPRPEAYAFCEWVGGNADNSGHSAGAVQTPASRSTGPTNGSSRSQNACASTSWIPAFESSSTAGSSCSSRPALSARTRPPPTPRICSGGCVKRSASRRETAATRRLHAEIVEVKDPVNEARVLDVWHEVTYRKPLAAVADAVAEVRWALDLEKYVGPEPTPRPGTRRCQRVSSALSCAATGTAARRATRRHPFVEPAIVQADRHGFARTRLRSARHSSHPRTGDAAPKYSRNARRFPAPRLRGTPVCRGPRSGEMPMRRADFHGRGSRSTHRLPRRTPVRPGRRTRTCTPVVCQ